MIAKEVFLQVRGRTTMQHSSIRFYIGLAFSIMFTASAEAGITIFASGLQVPESISLAPSGFGTYGGQLFVPDAGFNATETTPSTIYAIPRTGGTQVAIATVPDDIRAGMFLSSGYGANAGNYLMAGSSVLYTMNASGNVSTLADVTSSGYYALSALAQAPSGFAAGGGNIFITAQAGPDASTDGGILELNPSGQVSIFKTVIPNIISPFGLVFANGSFGAFSNQLLVSDGASGVIDAIGANGTISTFATLPLAESTGGLRQMAFIPQGYGALGGDLLVSVSGSFDGGGQLGALYALNSSGQIVAALDVGSQLNKFDPRGMYFLDNNTLLVNDASDPIYAITASSFISVPEPSSLLMVGIGLSVAGISRVLLSRHPAKTISLDV